MLVNIVNAKHLLGFLIVVILACACQQKDSHININNFSGLYSLYIMEQQDSITGKWSEWRSGMQGYILYDNNDNMAVHLTSRGYQNTDLVFPNFVDSISLDALKHLTHSYVYFAKYTVFEEEGVVEHARISHSNPGEWNKVVRRKFTFSGDTLMLEPLEPRNSALRLKWVRTQ